MFIPEGAKFFDQMLNCMELTLKNSHRKERTEFTKTVVKININVDISNN